GWRGPPFPLRQGGAPRFLPLLLLHSSWSASRAFCLRFTRSETPARRRGSFLCSTAATSDTLTHERRPSGLWHALGDSFREDRHPPYRLPRPHLLRGRDQVSADRPTLSAAQGHRHLGTPAPRNDQRGREIRYRRADQHVLSLGQSLHGRRRTPTP